MNEFMQISVCLNDIADGAIFQGENGTPYLDLTKTHSKALFQHKNGKWYLKVTAAPKKEIGKLGETHTVFLTGVESGGKRVYCGNGWKKEWYVENECLPNEEAPLPF